MRLYRSQQRLDDLVPSVTGILDRRLTEVDELRPLAGSEQRRLLDHLAAATEGRYPALNDLARDVRFRYFDQPVLLEAEAELQTEMDRHVEGLAAQPNPDERARHLAALVACPQPMRAELLRWYRNGDADSRDVAVEVAARRYYRIRDLTDLRLVDLDSTRVATAEYDHLGRRFQIVVAYAPDEELAGVVERIGGHMVAIPEDVGVIVDLHVWGAGPAEDVETTGERLRRTIEQVDLQRRLHRLDVTITSDPEGSRPPVTYHYTFRDPGTGLVEDGLYRNLHPMLAKRLELGRLSRFAIERLDSVEDVYLFHGKAHDNPKDERLFALAEVRDLTPARDESGEVAGFPLLERILMETLSSIRRFQSHRPPGRRLLQNTVMLYVRPRWTVPIDFWRDLAHKLAPTTRGLAIEEVVARVRVPTEDGGLRKVSFHVTNPGARGVVVRQSEPGDEPIEPLDDYGLKVLQTQRRGGVYPYELIRLLTPPAGAPSDFPAGEFVEHDLDEENHLVPVDRPPGQNVANLVVGLIRNVLATVPEGAQRVLIAGDPSRSLGSLTEAECRRILGAIDLAERLRIPVEWFAVSSGARISMTSGTENMDWIGAVLRRIITFTQGGGEVNLIVTGINVGAQPYWNAEATMLMHTRGILVMLPESAMVLTGKQALDFSGGVSAEDNLGIGGFERIMGPNGQAQYRAADLESACEILFHHYEHTYVVPGERFPRRARTVDPIDRDVCLSPHARVEGTDFTTVGDIFSDKRNPGRKKGFDIRSVMRAVADQDHEPLERWRRWRDADTAVVWDSFVGGIPVCVIGFESRPVHREGVAPLDGPSGWTSGTLFPQSSRKVARAINSAAGNRPIVVLANLSGFDGSPESMRTWQLEYGAEIGRAVTNFDGPIVFAVISRYHGGAFVVFSKQLNDNMEVTAVEGSFASVIGGAPAAAVVFTRDVDARTTSDPRVVEAAARAADPDAGPGRSAAGAERARVAHRGGAEREAGRGGRGVRAHPQHPPGARRGIGRPHHPRRHPAALHRRRARAGHGPHAGGPDQPRRLADHPISSNVGAQWSLWRPLRTNIG